MHPQGQGGRRIAESSAAHLTAVDRGSFTTTDIFRRLIRDDIVGGRFTRGRRRQVIRYAKKMGVPSSLIRTLIEQCSRQILCTGNPQEKELARRVAGLGVDAPPWLRVANTVGAVLVSYLLLLNYLL